MLLSAVSDLVVAQSSSEFPEGLLNNPVYGIKLKLMRNIIQMVKILSAITC